jgi:SAM-dependent methyltransferase
MLEIRHDNINETPALLEAYNEIYRNKGILLRDSLYLWFISLLKPEPGKILVDISCGQGRLVALADRMGLRPIGVDFSIDGIQIGMHDAPQSALAVGDGERLPFAEQFTDYVTHIGSLEHYIDPLRGAQEIARILKPDGKACIMVPNSFGLFGNILYVWKTGDIFDDGQPLQRYGTRGIWVNLLSAAGLHVEKIISHNEVPIPRTRSDALALLKKPRKLVRFFVNFFIPLNLTNHFVFICRRA